MSIRELIRLCIYIILFRYFVACNRYLVDSVVYLLAVSVLFEVIKCVLPVICLCKYSGSYYRLSVKEFYYYRCRSLAVLIIIINPGLFYIYEGLSGGVLISYIVSRNRCSVVFYSILADTVLNLCSVIFVLRKILELVLPIFVSCYGCSLTVYRLTICKKIDLDA